MFRPLTNHQDVCLYLVKMLISMLKHIKSLKGTPTCFDR